MLTVIAFFSVAMSFVALVRYIFSQPTVKSFLSQRICQDPLENFFGTQRQRGGTHDNPSVDQFIKNTQALRAIGSLSKRPLRGNCRGGTAVDQGKENDNPNQPLPKRRRRSKCSNKQVDASTD